MVNLVRQIGFGAICFVVGSAVAYFFVATSYSPEPRKEIDVTSLLPTDPNTPGTNGKTSDVADEFFRIYGDSRFTGHQWIRRSAQSDIAGRVSEFARKFGKSKTNTFYISQVESDDDGNSQTNDEYLYVYWKEDNGILILTPPYNIEDVTYFSWVYSMRRIDLTKDVVAERDVGTSNSLVSKAWLDRALDSCVKRGMKVTIDSSRFENRNAE